MGGASCLSSPTVPQPRSSSSPTSSKVKVPSLAAAHTATHAPEARPLAQGLHPLRGEASLRECQGKLRRCSSACPRVADLPFLTIQDYNPHGMALMLVYKHGSTHAGLDGYACPELSWLGLVASDVLEPLPRSLFTGSHADAERMLPPLWKRRAVWPATACMLCMAGRAGRRIGRGVSGRLFSTQAANRGLPALHAARPRCTRWTAAAERRA